MARRFATRTGAIRANRFARIDLQKKNIFITCKRFARIGSNLRFAVFSAPKRDSQKWGSVGEPSGDSRESGHLRSIFLYFLGTLAPEINIEPSRRHTPGPNALTPPQPTLDSPPPPFANKSDPLRPALDSSSSSSSSLATFLILMILILGA